jgi:hypothetical protein
MYTSIEAIGERDLIGVDDRPSAGLLQPWSEDAWRDVD